MHSGIPRAGDCAVFCIFHWIKDVVLWSGIVRQLFCMDLPCL